MPTPAAGQVPRRLRHQYLPGQAGWHGDRPGDRAAIRGLAAGDRDVIVLQLSHGLDAAEIAAVLGVSRNHAHALLSRARGHLQACVGALLVGRTGRRDCPQLNDLLASWDGQLTVLLRKRVSRHIEQCDTCSARQRAALRPAMLLGLAGGPALLGAAAAVRHGGQAATLTAAAKRKVLRAATGNTPTAQAKQAAVASRAARFGRDGFPKPHNPPGYGPWGTSRGQLVTAAAGTTAAAAAAVFAVMAGGPAPGGLADRAGGGGSGGSAGPSAVAPAASGGSPGPASPGAPAPGSAPGRGGGTSPAGGASPSPPAPGSVGQPTPVPATVPPTSGPPGTVPPTSAPPAAVPPATGPPSRPPATQPPTTVPPTTAPPPAQGTISVSAATVVLTPLLGSSLTVTAHGGPVSWSIAVPTSLTGKVLVSQSAGKLQAGQSVTVTITTSLASLDSHITVSPGGVQVAVVIGLL